MEYEIIRPNVSNFVKSLRDVGYTFEIAVADIIDNSVTANASDIYIFATKEPEMSLSILDNGVSMNEKELVEAMRLGSKDPSLERQDNDLGRFGLGLKTASFSQCKKMTVVTKQQTTVNFRQWDLVKLEEENEWKLGKPNEAALMNNEAYLKLMKQTSGTLVIWEDIDAIESEVFDETIINLNRHLSLVFHRFLEGETKIKKIKIYTNYNLLEPFNPFNPRHKATQILQEEKIKYSGHSIAVQPYILPHHSKISDKEYERYATEEGYTKSQGFYLYREGRLLIYGTWWGLNRVSDMHRLVRIKVDITNKQDHLWNIDVKKSTASPQKGIRTHLTKLLKDVLTQGTRPYTGRGRKINVSATVPTWEVSISPQKDDIRFTINKQHPFFVEIQSKVSEELQALINVYISSLEANLPITAIQSHMITNPYAIKQEEQMDIDDVKGIICSLREAGYTDEKIKGILDNDVLNKAEGLFDESH